VDDSFCSFPFRLALLLTSSEVLRFSLKVGHSNDRTDWDKLRLQSSQYLSLPQLLIGDATLLTCIPRSMNYFAQFSTAVEVCDYSAAACKYVLNPSLQTLFELLKSALSLAISHVDHPRFVVLIAASVLLILASPVVRRWVYR